MWQNVENEKVENQEQYLLNSLLFLVFFFYIQNILLHFYRLWIEGHIFKYFNFTYKRHS